jgi:hypothetical protein
MSELQIRAELRSFSVRNCPKPSRARVRVIIHKACLILNGVGDEAPDSFEAATIIREA